MFLESSGGAAMVTVLIGGLFGQLITNSIQSWNKEREFQHMWLQERGKMALEGYKEYVAGAFQTVRESFDQVGAMAAAARDIIIITQPGFDTSDRSPFSGEELRKLVEQKSTIRQRFNEQDAEWRRGKQTLGLLVTFHHGGKPEVARTWSGVAASVDGYVACARRWYLDHLGEPTPMGEACREEEEALNHALSAFHRELEAARRYRWEGWETPENMKRALAESSGK